MKAAYEGNDGCLKVLLEAGCDKEAKDNVRDEFGVVVIMTREIVSHLVVTDRMAARSPIRTGHGVGRVSGGVPRGGVVVAGSGGW